MVGGAVGRLIHPSIGRVGVFVDRSVGSSVGGPSVNWSTDRHVGIGRSGGRSIGRYVATSVGRPISLSFGVLVSCR